MWSKVFSLFFLTATIVQAAEISQSLSKRDYLRSLMHLDIAIRVSLENIKNSNTTAYKGLVVTFTSLDTKPKIFQSVRMGSLIETGRKLDLAIGNSIGYFKLKGGKGKWHFTRAGTFQIRADGTVVSNDGFELHPRLRIPSECILETLIITEFGIVSATCKDRLQRLGKVKLYRFPNAEALVTNHLNHMHPTRSSGKPIEGTPGLHGFGTTMQGVLEMSNVDIESQLIYLKIWTKTYSNLYNCLQYLNPKLLRSADLEHLYKPPASKTHGCWRPASSSN